MNRERIVQVFFFGLLALITYALYEVLQPFLVPIAWAILLAFLAHPAQRELKRLVRSSTAAAAIIAIAIALGVVLPAIWLSARLVRESQSMYNSLSAMSGRNGFVSANRWLTHTHLGARAVALLARQGIRLEDQINVATLSGAKLASSYVLEHSGEVASNLATFVFHFAIALITLFYLLRDGESYYLSMLELMPLHDDDKVAIFETLSATLSSVMRGLMLTALLDGVTIGLGYLVCGVPYWALLALATAAAGLLPMGGTAIVWIPVAIYLVFQTGWGAAILLAVWSTVALAIIDNFIKPIAMRQGTELPTLALFFGLAGGLEAFGPLGIFIGPAILAVFASLLKVYRRTYLRPSASEAATIVPSGAIVAPAPVPEGELAEQLERPVAGRFGEQPR
ncbi:MAG TPA: AI-2E family transporter [Candidatus Binataceae bacterium]|jgi:predicted PurR-regulated permease PerM|nr:AI-2E family transporter [Candidatus Binataceae bacterium]